MAEAGRKRRLVSKAELARLAGVTPQSISSAVKRGLKSAVFGKKIDLNHPAAVAYLAGRPGLGNGVEEGIDDHAAPANKVSVPQDMSDDVGSFMDMTLTEILTTFDTVSGFQSWLKSIKLIADIMDRRIRIDERSDKLIPKKMVVDAIINPVETAHIGLLRDGAVTIAVTVNRMSKAGSSEAEMRKAVQSILSGFISGLKESMAVAINNASHDNDGSNNQ